MVGQENLQILNIWKEVAVIVHNVYVIIIAYYLSINILKEGDVDLFRTYAN